MAQITIQILEGMERGRAFEGVPTPITIGREDDNVIRLNDERVSRFHAKIQHDGDRVILTDLDSTNGTRVNGHPIQIHVLQPGDLLWIGRCVLVFGSKDEIAARQLAESHDSTRSDGTVPLSNDESSGMPHPSTLEEYGELFPNGPPEVPGSLALAQRAQLSDILAYVHDRIRRFMEAGKENLPKDSDSDSSYDRHMVVEWASWQELVGLEMDIAEYLRKVAEPES